jgi:hypothetical protein
MSNKRLNWLNLMGMVAIWIVLDSPCVKTDWRIWANNFLIIAMIWLINNEEN